MHSQRNLILSVCAQKAEIHMHPRMNYSSFSNILITLLLTMSFVIRTFLIRKKIFIKKFVACAPVEKRTKNESFHVGVLSFSLGFR